MKTSAPNIIFLFSDQQRWDTLGCYGQKLPVTPNLDSMAADGVKFDLAFTCQPVCGPARAALQTGKYPTEVGCPTNHHHLPRNSDTLANRLKAVGYRTGYIGKWHLASGPNCLDPNYNPEFRIFPVPAELRGGYDDWLAADVLEYTSHAYDGHMFDAAGEPRFFPVNRYRVDAQTDWVLEQLDQYNNGSQPFFLFVSYIEPHHQNDHNRYEGPHGSKEKWGNYEVPGDLIGQAGDWAENYPDYLGCCNALDGAVGRIRQKLAERGMSDNTLMVYTSDHGSHFRTRNGEYKRSCHDGCLRIPLILSGPGFSGGQVSRNLVSLIDLPQTILTAAGAAVASGWQGTPLQQELAQDGGREAVYAQLSESQVGRCIRTSRWKYSVRSPEPVDAQTAITGCAPLYHGDFLYDLATDPHEQKNLVSDSGYAAVRQEMADLLRQCMAQANEPPAEIR